MSQSVDRQTDLVGHNNNNNKVITNPLAMSLLIGLKKDKCISDSDFVRSPKSPLEFKMLSTMAADPLFLRSPRSSLAAHLNSPAKVGLSIVDSLGDDRILSPDVVFGPALRIKSSDIKDKHPKSLKIEKERSGVIFEIGSFSADDCPTKTRVLSQSKFPRIGSDNAFSSEDEMEMSEDYTCIITHGPNPKTTHIYGDQVSELDSMFPLDNFLSVCNFCNKKLVLGKDIYMYRGEKAFCSAECRSEEMTIDEEDVEDSCVVMHGSLKKLLF
ncbi:FCS-Like Zinc finger 11 isoform X3 [Brassica rapa]|uniref:FCS-Like Zinc finger 11 isoform X3 n=1 Tax=Brassica campestris TaxID=3711 RepID=UPI00142D6DE2|nr:FCS-Like Zinc finger 11 isoform X3 [Brassica rapa]